MTPASGKVTAVSGDPVKAFVEWARGSAATTDDFPDYSGDIERFAPFDQALEGKRIVYLGESSHWVHEKVPYRLLLIRYLFSRGWRFVGEELSGFDGWHVDQYLEGGDPAQLDRLAVYGYEGGKRTDRDDSATGILAGGSSFPTDLFRAEQIRLYSALRETSEGRSGGSERLNYFGFDAEYVPGAGYEYVTDLLASAPGTSPFTEIRSLLALVLNETVAEEIARLGAVLEAVEKRYRTLKQVMGDEWSGRLRHALLNMRDSFDYIRVANPATDWETVNVAMAMRETIMQRNVLWLLSRIGPDEKIILMSHNQHLAKDDAGIKTPDTGAGPGGGIVPSLGCYLNRLFPEEVFSVWMLFDHGRDSQPYASLSNDLQSPPSSLNAALNQVAPVFMMPTHSIDPRSQLLAGETEINSMYNQVIRATMANQADAIFFINEVSPLRPAGAS
jgi:erythromycin esterase-like protein